MAQPLQKIIANRYGGRNLPVTLVLPDGGRVPLSSEPEVEILARTWRGLKALAAPAMGALARAYVHNDIDFTGSARRAIAIAEAMVGEIAHGRDSLTTRWRIWRHQRRSNRANIGYHYDVSNAFYRLWLDPQLVYSLRVFHGRGRRSLDDAQAAKLDHICRKLRLAPGERFLDIGCGWGALLFQAARELRRRRHRHHAVEEPVRPREGARSPRAGSRDRVRVELRDYLDLPEDALYDKIASVGMFEHVGIARFPQVLRQDPTDPEARRVGAEPRHHAQPARRARASAAASAISSRNTCSPAASSRTSPRSSRGWRRRGSR